jgi:hypothetical protein
VGVGPHDRPVLSPAVLVAGADGCNVCNRSLGLELEVVGVDRIHPLLGPTQHVE